MPHTIKQYGVMFLVALMAALGMMLAHATDFGGAAKSRSGSTCSQASALRVDMGEGGLQSGNTSLIRASQKITKIRDGNGNWIGNRYRIGGKRLSKKVELCPRGTWRYVVLTPEGLNKNGPPKTFKVGKASGYTTIDVMNGEGGPIRFRIYGRYK